MLLKEELYVFEKNEYYGSKSVLLYGEYALPWTSETYRETFRNLSKELADFYNDHDLSKIDLDIVYVDIDSSVIKDLTNELFPFGRLQLFYFWKIIPQILYNLKKLKAYDKRIVVMFCQEKYAISLDNHNKLSLSLTKQTPEMIVKIEDLPRYLNLLV